VNSDRPHVLQKPLGSGRQAEVFAWGEGRVLKLSRFPSGAGLEREASVLRAAGEVGAPVPGVFEETVVDGRPGVVMERLDGPDLLTLVGNRPWQVWRIGVELGRTHRALHASPLPPGLPELHEAVAAKLQGSAAIPADAREFGRALLAQLPGGDRLCHGDFHPGNVIRTPAGCKVIDFENAVAGDAAADHAATRTILRMGEPPAVSWYERLLLGAGRKLMLRAYLRGYGATFDPAVLRKWELLFLCQRLGDEIPEERERILAEIRAARRQGWPGPPA
jgi:aminoglycoside phosphotransferase (APT) family kinase protein